MNEQKKAKKMHLIIAVVSIIVLALIYFIYTNYSKKNESELYAMIRNGDENIILPLAEDRILGPSEIITDLAVEITIKDGGVAFTKSNCPDKVCIKAGVLRHEYESASCLPAGVSVLVFENQENETVFPS